MCRKCDRCDFYAWQLNMNFPGTHARRTTFTIGFLGLIGTQQFSSVSHDSVTINWSNGPCDTVHVTWIMWHKSQVVCIQSCETLLNGFISICVGAMIGKLMNYICGFLWRKVCFTNIGSSWSMMHGYQLMSHFIWVILYDALKMRSLCLCLHDSIRWRCMFRLLVNSIIWRAAGRLSFRPNV